KVLTAAAVLSLADSGKLSLDDPLTEWLPAMPPTYQETSIRSLLNHTSGLPAYHSLLNQSQTRDCSDLVVLRALSKTPKPIFPSGTRCEYSNSAYILLGLIVQQASARPFQDYLREEILRPAGMQDSVLLVEGLNTVTVRAYGHLPGIGDTRPGSEQWHEGDQDGFSRVGGDGALYTSLDDLQ
ncbi:unnamed protein product, partial [Ectocarpus sp. 4 AP-2014]